MALVLLAVTMYFVISPSLNRVEVTVSFKESLQNVYCDIPESKEAAKININTADYMLLLNIPYIGEVKAQSIIDYRNANGAFLRIEDIMNVSGIGKATFDKLKDYISVD